METEAYLGLEDPACHSFSGKITPRTSTLYLPAGHTYVYLVYGMHHCLNVVCGDTTQPEAVLIRGVLFSPHLNPISDLENRFVEGAGLGPGKLCRALNIDRSHNRINLQISEELFIEEPTLSQSPQLKYETTPRIGIDYAGDAAHWPLRFVKKLI